MTVPPSGASSQPGATGREVTLEEATIVVEEKKTELAGKSDELLEAVQKLKETETRKRQEPISSDSFHRLANEVDAISHEVFSIARDQRHLGDRTSPAHETIEEVDGDRKRAEAP
jgi:vacuolar-type H+-ATPase subunit I/STV1